MAIVNMSDNEDLLADDLGDHSLADYNLGNDEEDQLLADDYESGGTQNVPVSTSYNENADAAPSEYSHPQVQPEVQYPKQRIQYHLQPDTECVVPNITVEVANAPERPSYAPYEPPETYEVEQHVPPAMPSTPMESPQIVPTEMSGVPPDDSVAPRSRFTSERPAGAQRTPQLRDIPDTLDKVVVPRGGWGGGRGRTSWRAPHYQHQSNQYRRNNMHRGNFNPRAQFPPPRNMRPNSPQMPPQMRPEIRPDLTPMHPDLPPNVRPDLPPNIRPDLPPNVRPDLPPNIRPDLPPNVRPDLPLNVRPGLPPNRPDMPPEGLPPNDLQRPEFRPEMRPDVPLPPGQDLPPEGLIMDPFRPMERPPFRFQYRPENPRFNHPDGPRHFNPNMRPNFDPFYRPFRPFLPMREVAPNMNHIQQVTIRHQGPPGPMVGHGGPLVGKQEVRMLPVQLPPVPGGLQGKKVLINPHFKGNFQPPHEVLSGSPVYIPTRIQKSPPLSPTLENKFGPVKDIDDAAERFIAEQRNALARAATRKFPPPRRSPQRYITENTIEIENDLARSPRKPYEDDDLLRRQEEFINANRAGLRRRMRSPTPPPRRSASPRRSPPRTDRPERLRARIDTNREENEEDGEYRRRMREQEALRDRVMRAKEARRRKRAVAATEPAPASSNDRPARTDDRDRDRLEKEPPKPKETPKPTTEPTTTVPDKPDTTRKSPEKEIAVEKERDRSPIRKEEEAEVNSTSGKCLNF
ncbi:hypothetical protein O0L34_g18641 [Tuta absoluta]|nr:hypothetical protein O0L34_g18641 [Tuta absoluta]